MVKITFFNGVRLNNESFLIKSNGKVFGFPDSVKLPRAKWVLFWIFISWYDFDKDPAVIRMSLSILFDR